MMEDAVRMGGSVATGKVAVSARGRIRGGRVLLWVAAGLLGLYCLLPLYWIVVQSFMPEHDIFNWPPYLIPPRLTLENYAKIFTKPDLPLGRWIFNSLFVAFSHIGLELFIAALAAYAFARLEFPGRDALFMVLLASMMIPGQVTLVPMYLQMARYRWLNTFHALIWPSVASVFPVFMLRQFMQTIPDELEEAAVLDGCGRLRVLFRIMVPLCTPAFSALAVFIFMGNWNSLFWPLIATDTVEMRLLVPGLAGLQGTYNQERGMVLAVAIVSFIPVMIFYSIFQSKIVEGVTMTGLAGT